jgi:hypothetical protein
LPHKPAPRLISIIDQIHLIVEMEKDCPAHDFAMAAKFQKRTAQKSASTIPE